MHNEVIPDKSSKEAHEALCEIMRPLSEGMEVEQLAMDGCRLFERAEFS
jgi:hypothetical protein